MVDGTGSDRLGQPEDFDADAMAGVAPENREHVARLSRMSWEELCEIGRKADEEYARRERFAEIP